ncbi:hypothetical protein OH76DRAFT_1483407 [Lentinus brumalis]|uniref:DUF6533 domain-containing protein n=1 Tax=Lentinus brumalis TaxID=2498619 RepID=A0A371D9J9_9APHY|nr:hypothetical protein OH76DRAFT_1483407 [Polyporus brumalis]
MSSDAATGAAAIVALFDSLFTGAYCQQAASVLFIYDTFVTFDREVTCFWTGQWTGAPLLFFANKWVSIVYYAMTFAELAHFSSDKRLVHELQNCSVVQNAVVAFEFLQFVPGAVFSALRAYVLSRSKLLGVLILALSLAPVGANLVDYGYQLSGENLPLIGCVELNNETEPIILRLGSRYHISVILISRVPLIIADTILIYITWAKLGSRGTLTGIRQSKRLSLSAILFRDGTIYFVVLFVLNVLHLVLSATGIAGNEQGSYMTEFTVPITTVLLSRFLLDLQEANQTVVRLDCDDPLHSSRDPYDVPSFISSLGAFINPDLLTRSDDELDWEVPSSPDEEKEHYIKAAAQGIEWSSESV